MTRRVEATAELDSQLGDGSTLRETLTFQKKMYGVNDPRLIEETIPYTAIPIWNAYWQLHSTRASTKFGFQPITYTEIDAYTRLMQSSFDPWEIDVIKRMDIAFLIKINTSNGSK